MVKRRKLREHLLNSRPSQRQTWLLIVFVLTRISPVNFSTPPDDDQRHLLTRGVDTNAHDDAVQTSSERYGSSEDATDLATYQDLVQHVLKNRMIMMVILLVLILMLMVMMLMTMTMMLMIMTMIMLMVMMMRMMRMRMITMMMKKMMMMVVVVMMMVLMLMLARPCSVRRWRSKSPSCWAIGSDWIMVLGFASAVRPEPQHWQPSVCDSMSSGFHPLQSRPPLLPECVLVCLHCCCKGSFVVESASGAAATARRSHGAKSHGALGVLHARLA